MNMQQQLKIARSKAYLDKQIKNITNTKFYLDFKINDYSVSIKLSGFGINIRLRTIMVGSVFWNDDCTKGSTFDKKMLDRLARKSKEILEMDMISQ